MCNFGEKCSSGCLRIAEFPHRLMAFGGADAKQSLERRHRSLPSVEAKNELVHVGLQIFWLNAVVSSHEPCFQIRIEPGLRVFSPSHLHPSERFVHDLSTPPALPDQVWINKPMRSAVSSDSKAFKEVRICDKISVSS